MQAEATVGRFSCSWLCLGGKWRDCFQMDSSITIPALYRNTLRWGRNWGASVVFAYVFLHNLVYAATQ